MSSRTRPMAFAPRCLGSALVYVYVCVCVARPMPLPASAHRPRCPPGTHKLRRKALLCVSARSGREWGEEKWSGSGERLHLQKLTWHEQVGSSKRPG